MVYNPDKHHRRSIRLADYEYSQGGAYFVTICVHGRECLFGEIENGEMALNEMGRIVAEEWRRTETVRSNVITDEFVVMPNHIHGIIFITDTDESMGATRFAHHRINGNGRRGAPTCAQVTPFDPDAMKNRTDINGAYRAHISAPLRRQSGSIGSIVAGFKSTTTKQINMLRDNPGSPVWQRNYYERVIRNDGELSRAREYIANNPLKWEDDRENPIYVPAVDRNPRDHRK